MQTVCKFTVPGAPIPWARARGGGGHGSGEGKAKQQSFYTAPAQKRAKGAVKSYGAHDMLQRRIARMHDGRPVALGVPLIFDCRTYLPIPSKFTRAEERAAAAGLLLPAVKPDLDNWIKLPMDALEGVAYSGDGQIVGFGGSGKWYSRTPRQEIHVYHAPASDAVPVDIGDLLAWFGGKPQLALEHFGPVYGDDDDQSEGWRVMRVSGPINDREWDEVGRGSTPAEAIGAARATLEKEQ